MILLFSVFLSHMALANDGYSAIGAGGIVFKKSSHIDMSSEVLTISETNVNVKYEFLNRVGVAEKVQAQKALVAFPLPEMTCGYWGKAKVPEDFSVLVDGKKVKFSKEVKAFKGEEDVTDQIKKAGLPLDCRELMKDKALYHKGQKAKWVDDNHDGDPEDVRYTTRITYFWEQEFPPNQVVNIEHSYTPILGMDAGHPAWFFNQAPHWDRDPNVRWTSPPKVKTMEYQISDVMGGKSLQYVLMTAKTWKMGGVGRFKLILKRDNPDTFVGSTLGPLKAIDKNTFEFRAGNFAPDRDLAVFFGKSK